VRGFYTLMTREELHRLAHRIWLMKGKVPDDYRLMFALAIRELVQETRPFPGWEEFLTECNLTGDENAVQ
jgi:hypothetical protein